MVKKLHKDWIKLKGSDNNLIDTDFEESLKSNINLEFLFHLFSV